MPRPSVVPLILSVLEPYLEAKHREYLGSGSETPTLPDTSEGKVNVRAVVRDLMQLDARIMGSHEQHFFRRKELSGPVDAIAQEQGLAPIGSRAVADDQDAARQRIGKLARESSELRQILAEREALIEKLRQENAGLRERVELMEETGLVFRTGDAI